VIEMHKEMDGESKEKNIRIFNSGKSKAVIYSYEPSYFNPDYFLVDADIVINYNTPSSANMY